MEQIPPQWGQKKNDYRSFLELVRTPAASLQRPPRIGRDGVALALADLPALAPQRLQIKSDLQSNLKQVGKVFVGQ